MSKAVLSHRARIVTLTPVSVLDLEQYRSRGRTPDDPLLGTTSDTDVFSLNDVNFRPVGRVSTSAEVLTDQTASLTNRPDGGSRWTRTIDLTLIRRVL